MGRAARRLLEDDSGATAVEYGLIVALIAATIIITVIALGIKVRGLYSSFDDDFPT